MSPVRKQPGVQHPASWPCSASLTLAHLRELSSTKGFRLRRRASFACFRSSRTSCTPGKTTSHSVIVKEGACHRGDVLMAT